MTQQKFIFRIIAFVVGASLVIGVQSVDAAVAKKKAAVKKSVVCARCKSKAEGVDKTAAARANEWTGTIIGVNFGEQSVVITEGVALDHIKKFAQRSIKIKPETELFKNDEQITFDALDVGQRITAAGTYDAARRIVTADRVDVGIRVAANPAVEKPKNAPVEAIEKSKVVQKVAPSAVKKVAQSSGNGTAQLQKKLIDKGFLNLPKGTKLGNFGEQTKTALEKYQKSVGLPITGTLGPKTRAKLGL